MAKSLQLSRIVIDAEEDHDIFFDLMTDRWFDLMPGWQIDLMTDWLVDGFISRLVDSLLFLYCLCSQIYKLFVMFEIRNKSHYLLLNLNLWFTQTIDFFPLIREVRLIIPFVYWLFIVSCVHGEIITYQFYHQQQIIE